jgi:hypothetical protein
VDDTPRNIEEIYFSPDADFWKEVVWTEMIQLCLMELGKLLNVLMGVNL